MLPSGANAPSFSLPDMETGAAVSDPWVGGRTILAFFKTTCPVCVMVAPKISALSGGGARVVGVGQDPPAALRAYARSHGQLVPTLSEPAPYPVSAAYGLSSVPTLFVIGSDGVLEGSVGGWDRDRWNQLAASFDLAPISSGTDGLPVFRPG